MFRRVRSAGAVVGMAWLLLAGCGTSGSPAPASGGSRGQFVLCSGAGGIAGYAILDNPGPDCRPLVAGQDYADGRVIIGLRPGTADDELRKALAAYHATVISSQPELSDKVLAVPKGTVPQAVVGLARYPFLAFASPDMIAHINMTS